MCPSGKSRNFSCFHFDIQKLKVNKIVRKPVGYEIIFITVLVLLHQERLWPTALFDLLTMVYRLDDNHLKSGAPIRTDDCNLSEVDKYSFIKLSLEKIHFDQKLPVSLAMFQRTCFSQPWAFLSPVWLPLGPDATALQGGMWHRHPIRFL